MELSHHAVAATHAATREPLNWPVLVGLLACLLFWGAVVVGIVGVV